MTRIAGLDLSLTNTGVAVHDSVLNTTVVTSFGSDLKNFKPDNLPNRIARIDFMLTSLQKHMGSIPFDAIGIEAPAYASSTGKVWDRAGWWWEAVRFYQRSGAEVIEVSPNGRSKYATGDGRANKDTVLLAAARFYTDIEFKNNDQVDAFIICAMICRLKGIPLEKVELPKNKLAAMLPLSKDK